ncbi:MAG: response regulator [Gemmatimonadota bacterium]
MRRVLFVDDESRVLDGLQRMLRPHRDQWEMVFAVGGGAGLEELARGSFDVVVTDMRMPGVDGLALLSEVARLSPETVRIVLSGQTEFGVALGVLPLAHQFLMKPCEAATLEQAIEQSCRLRDLLHSESVRRVIGGIGTVPVAPAIYSQLVVAVEDPGVSLARLAGIVEKDVGLASKVLQSVNSSFFGVGRRVSSLTQAVSLLGVRLLRSLVLSHEVLRPIPSTPDGPQFDVEAEGAHALSVARVARRLVPIGSLAEDASVAGLLHDIGRFLLYAYLPAETAAADKLSREMSWPLHRAEQEILGTTHAEVGAYLLGLWGLPHSVVEAVAYHHSLDRVQGPEVTPAVAVYLANLAVGRGTADGDPYQPERDAVAGDARLAPLWEAALEQSRSTE